MQKSLTKRMLEKTLELMRGTEEIYGVFCWRGIDDDEIVCVGGYKLRKLVERDVVM